MNVVKMRKLTRAEIQKAIKDPLWQTVRLSMKGVPLKEKSVLLKNWYKTAKNKKKAEVQIINYINALKRGGLIKA